MAAMGQQVWEQVRPRWTYQRFLSWVGTALIISGLLHVGMLVVDPGPWYGPVSWRKPIVFGVSFGLTAWGVAWVLGRLPRRGWLGWLTGGTLGVASLVEVAAITLQRWRGVPSHFNDATPLDQAVFGVMGMSVVLVGVAILAILVWASFGLRDDPVAWWPAVVGLGSIVAASRIGVDMIGEGQAVLEATGQVPTSIVFGAAGSAKLAHAVGMHGLQVLAGLAVVLRLGGLPVERRRALVRLAAVSYAGLFVVVALQAYAGRALQDLPAASVVIALAAALALGRAALHALRSWRETSRLAVVA